MRKIKLKFVLPVSFMCEGDKHIAYTPVLDLSTWGNTCEEARKRFEEIVQIFFEELINKDMAVHAIKTVRRKRI